MAVFVEPPPTVEELHQPPNEHPNAPFMNFRFTVLHGNCGAIRKPHELAQKPKQ